MKVKDLIAELKKVDDEMDVYCTSKTGYHEYCAVNTVGARSILIDGDYEDEFGNDKEVDVFVIDEE